MLPRRERATSIAETAGASTLVVAHPSIVTWLTGYAPEIESGPSPFALPPIAVLGSAGRPVLVVSDDEAEAALRDGLRGRDLPGLRDRPARPGRRGRASAAPRCSTGRRSRSTPARFRLRLQRGLDWVDVGDELVDARARSRIPDEVELIRAAIAVCDAGQRAARAHAAGGNHRARALGRRPRRDGARRGHPAAGAGRSRVRPCARRRSAAPPSSRIIEDGDLVLCDLVPRVGGYWGDSCATFAVGEPSAEAREAHARARAVLDELVAAIGPGPSPAIWTPSRGHRSSSPTTRAMGSARAIHEEPRLVPGSTTVLEAGMVVAIEPGTYAGAGVRVEQVVLVTAGGCEVLSGHDALRSCDASLHGVRRGRKMEIQNPKEGERMHRKLGVVVAVALVAAAVLATAGLAARSSTATQRRSRRGRST